MLRPLTLRSLLLRPLAVLAVLAGASWVLLVLCVVGNLVAIRSGSPLLRSERPEPPAATPKLASGASRSAPAPAQDPLQASIGEAAAQAARRHIEEAAGPLQALSLPPAETRVQFAVESPRRGLWVTRTELRVPCRALDAALARRRDASLGRPGHCERWVEAAATVLESHGLTTPTAREFLETYAGEQTVRVLVVYAGWVRDSPQSEVRLVGDRAAPVLPRSGFARAQRRARQSVYRMLELGPYAAEPPAS